MGRQLVWEAPLPASHGFLCCPGPQGSQPLNKAHCRQAQSRWQLDTDPDPRCSLSGDLQPQSCQGQARSSNPSGLHSPLTLDPSHSCFTRKWGLCGQESWLSPCPAQRGQAAWTRMVLGSVHVAQLFWAPTLPAQGRPPQEERQLLLQSPTEGPVHTCPQPLVRRKVHRAHGSAEAEQDQGTGSLAVWTFSWHQLQWVEGGSAQGSRVWSLAQVSKPSSDRCSSQQFWWVRCLVTSAHSECARL